MLDAGGLGQGNLGFAFAFGFPWVMAQAGVGVLDRLDLHLVATTPYGAALQVGLGPQLRLAGGRDGFALALRLRGQAAVFRTRALAEETGVRYVTGMRNFGIEPSLVASVRGRLGSAWAAVRYQGTFDTEPVALGPLAGNPGTWRYGSNLALHVGGELAPSGPLHLFADAALEFHLSGRDFPVIPTLLVGFTFPG